jgi:outer membrane protein assembly factor BamE (lipoprotein component of BamABCDE complex)
MLRLINKESLPMNIIQSIVLTLLVALATACTSTSSKPNTKFDRPSGNLVKPGVTTESQVIAKMGKPLESYYMIREEDGTKSKTIRYAYTDYPHYRGVIFSFIDNILVSYIYWSDFPDDSTYFNMSKVDSFTEGISTRKDVEMALGEPSGKSIYPFLRDPNRVAIHYMYNYIPSGTKRRINRGIQIEFDNNDVVQEIMVTHGPNNEQ